MQLIIFYCAWMMVRDCATYKDETNLLYQAEFHYKNLHHFLQHNRWKWAFCCRQMLVFHAFKHHLSFLLMDFTSAVIKKLCIKISIFDNKFWISGSECFGLFVMQQKFEDLISAKYLSLMMDTSVHKSLKLVPVFFRHFTPEKRIEIKIIDI